MTIEGNRTRLALLLVALVLVGVGIWVLVVQGANRPADPELGASVGAVSPTGSEPGDPDRVLLDGFGEVAITVDPGDGTGLLAWCLLAALDAQQRGRGLMEVTDLQGYSGMVFVYEEDVANGFYMRNTPTPLSIAWVAADGGVVTTTDMAPCEDRDGCPTYSPDGPYRYAIEVFQGDLPDLGITEDATVSVGGRCAPTSTS
jgi:uncharacterized membrane protein (UPF0127 family)